MDVSQILLWITVGLVAAIGVAYGFVKFRDYRNRFNPTYPQPQTSVEQAINRQTGVIKGEMRAAEEYRQRDRDERDAEVKEALHTQQTAVKQDLDAQSDVIQQALAKYESATKTDLSDQTRVVTDALADNAKRQNGKN